jgi:ribosomal protein L37AE/L43A
MAECIECGAEYSDKRLALGYRTCLDCGESGARTRIRAQVAANLRAMAPNHYTGDVREVLDKRPD